jgi:putative oxidoreductase
MATTATAICGRAKSTSITKDTAVLAGRILFGLIFILSGPTHFMPQTIAFAASQGIPLASIAVPFSGLMALAGGLSIAFGYRTKIGALLIALFLIGVTPMMHQFWGVADHVAAQNQMAHFMKNLALLGGALLISQFGAGSLSFDERRSRSFASGGES